jgi:acetyltransferase-like isoleucine patch superfamily enzyme
MHINPESSGEYTTTLGDNVYLGVGSIILPGVTIGDNSVIGAGAIVTRDVPPGVVAVGNPARVIKEIARFSRPNNGGTKGEDGS